MQDRSGAGHSHNDGNEEGNDDEQLLAGVHRMMKNISEIRESFRAVASNLLNMLTAPNADVTKMQSLCNDWSKLEQVRIRIGQ